MKTVFNTLNIIYFILIIITIIILIYYINKFYLKKEKFTEQVPNPNPNTLKCDYVYNKKVLIETCRDLQGKLVKANTYISNNKQELALPEDINDIFVNDDLTKKCEVMGKLDDTIIAKCCPNNGADPKLCVSNSYETIKNKNVL